MPPPSPTLAPRRPRWRRRLLRLSLILAALPILSAVAFFAAVAFLPYPERLDHPRPAGTFIEDRRGTPLAAFVATDEQWHLPLDSDQVSPHLLNAVIAVEDIDFYHHSGVNWKSAAAAAWQNVTSLRIRRGASTITMQVQRLRAPGPHSFLYKIEQAVRAAQLEKRLTKQQILLEYINRAPFGGNLVGAGAASWRYFGRPCRDLSLAQAALLAAIPNSPNRYRPDLHPDQAKARRDLVLRRMTDLNMISESQRQQAAVEPLDAAWRPLPQLPASPSLPLANAALPTLLSLARQFPGQSLRTTLDASIQQFAAEAAAAQLRQLEPCGVTAAAIVILDNPSAQCLAAVSISSDSAAVDLTRAPRSSGSTLKPFLYAAAMMFLWTCNTVLLNSAGALMSTDAWGTAK